jgi:hypothetical protein
MLYFHVEKRWDTKLQLGWRVLIVENQIALTLLHAVRFLFMPIKSLGSANCEEEWK